MNRQLQKAQCRNYRDHEINFDNLGLQRMIIKDYRWLASVQKFRWSRNSQMRPDGVSKTQPALVGADFPVLNRYTTIRAGRRRPAKYTHDRQLQPDISAAAASSRTRKPSAVDFSELKRLCEIYYEKLRSIEKYSSDGSDGNLAGKVNKRRQNYFNLPCKFTVAASAPAIMGLAILTSPL
uniref:Uncharacterized protein n=1 Tax=Romanomermis culicivorax TaxID=13658 RepID=A0A915IHK9_ROMCU